MNAKDIISSGKAILGIEFGSTRIKAVLIDDTYAPIAQGAHDWENRLENGIWTYSMSDIENGLRDCYKSLTKDVWNKYGTKITRLAGIGFSAMMHGYMAFNDDGELLVPFRTWRNSITGDAAKELTGLFDYNIPQRWSIAHLYQAMLNKEEHLKDISFFTTLDGFIHWKLTGNKVLGIGEASGMFPVDIDTKNYDARMAEKFNALADKKGYDINILNLLPKILPAGQNAGTLTKEGALFIDPTGTLESGIPLCPPEGDAGTGMVATNSVRERTGNISAGTSVFAMVVLEKALKNVYPEIDLVTTPTGSLVAMVHCNNCTSDINAWINLLKGFLDASGIDMPVSKLYEALFNAALLGDADCGGLLSYNYLSGENVTGLDEGRPLFVRKPDSKFSFSNFARVHICSALASLKVGLDILNDNEDITIDKMFAHGGLYKTPVVGQRLTAAAINAPVSVMSTAGEGGAWGMALLCAYMLDKKADQSLEDFLSDNVFKGDEGTLVKPDEKEVLGFNEFIKAYKQGIEIEKSAVLNMK